MVKNPRFPHECTIRRKGAVTPFDDGLEFEVYCGVCRRQIPSNTRSFNTGDAKIGQVGYADYRISMPGKVEIHDGDFADVFFGIGKDCRVTLFGANYSVLADCTEAFYNAVKV